LLFLTLEVLWAEYLISLHVDWRLVRFVTMWCDASHTASRQSRLISLNAQGARMASRTVPPTLSTFLEHHCQKVYKPKSAVLFRRGERAFGVFLVLSGGVSLDAEINRGQPQCCSSGALVGLPATLSKGNYSMTATVTEDAELGFLPPDLLDSLMHENPDLSQAVLKLLSERMLEIRKVQKALLRKQMEGSRQISSSAFVNRGMSCL
jgi:CRP-like cAMP-binding protein